MKLTRLKIESLLGIKSLDLTLDSPITLIAGPNGSGKSSLVECLRLALIAETPRVDRIKEYGQLVHAGAKAGSIELQSDRGTQSVNITAAGKITDSAKNTEAPAALPYLLDPPRFAALDVDARRSFLFALMRLLCDAQAVVERLLKRGCDQERIDAIAPLLLAGFDTAHKEAAKRATEAKGAWRAATGETYGEKKAATWRAPVPQFSGDDATELTGIDRAIAALEAELGEAQKRFAVAEHEARKDKERSATIVHLREVAKGYAGHADRVKKTLAALADAKAVLLDAQRRAGTMPAEIQTQLACPNCGALLMDSDDGESLVVWEAPDSAPYDPESAARLPDLTKAVETYTKVLARHQANMEAADQAGHQLKALEDQAVEKLTDPEPIRQTITSLQEQIAGRRVRQRELQTAQRVLDEADAKTKTARHYHADVLAWSAIADALAPDGIPGDLLSEALGPINDRLRQSAADTGWMQARVTQDMGITADGRPYRLCSGSERWRIDAQISEAISHLSGLKVLALDEADILDIPARGELLGWLDLLAAEGELESAIVCATLKALPANLPDSYQAIWIECGEVTQRQELEAA